MAKFLLSGKPQHQDLTCEEMVKQTISVHHETEMVR